MSRQTLLQIWKNKGQILEGIKNYVIVNEDIDDIHDERMKICRTCPSLDEQGSKCAVPGAKPCCGTCGCTLAFKLRALSAECPEGKWGPIVTQAEEDALRSNAK